MAGLIKSLFGGSKKVESAQSCSLSQQVTFSIAAPKASKVEVAGTFNNWKAADTLLKKEKNGTWKVSLGLPPGTYEYRYIVDGNWTSDSQSPTVENPFGTSNNIIEVPRKN